ncbi:MAG: alanine--tRNA ligase-related protein [Patescibacteria group bacterium]
MQSAEIRRRFIEFFKKRGHAVIPSASLVPENDPSVLFTTAGMQPLIPYLSGVPHPQGRRLVNVQKCVRTQDIDEVGDNTHDTFFEMLGNWSLGDYFKKEAIEWSYEFLTSKEEGLGLDPKRLYITCFEGDENAPRDTESAKIWESLGIPKNRIYFLGADDNWWSPGESGPCGPDTEMFYDLSGGMGDLSEDEFVKNTNEQKIVEVWNDVFMEYQKKDDKVTGKLAQQNVDTGAGLERLAMVMQGKDNIFDTDLFAPIMEEINKLSSMDDARAKRIIADHVRTSVFMIADGVVPSNTDRGYVLRRLLRRAVRYTDKLKMKPRSLFLIAQMFIKKYKNVYPNIDTTTEQIKKEVEEEESRFRKNLSKAYIVLSKKFPSVKPLDGTSSYGNAPDMSPIEVNGKLERGYIPPKSAITGKYLFNFYQTFGFPFELAMEEIQKIYRYLPYEIEKLKKEFNDEFKKHQNLSRAGAGQKFKGGLLDHSPQSIKYHTATHLLHKALKEVLGSHVFQKGSNITPERLRFDFSFERKMTGEERKKVEDLVNEKIKEKLPVSYEDIPIEEAEKRGALGLFEEKYGDKVRVYEIGDFSLEFCGGPHVKNTSELGHFKISKEEAVAQGIRRIKAILE